MPGYISETRYQTWHNQPGESFPWCMSHIYVLKSVYDRFLMLLNSSVRIILIQCMFEYPFALLFLTVEAYLLPLASLPRLTCTAVSIPLLGRRVPLVASSRPDHLTSLSSTPPPIHTPCYNIISSHTLALRYSELQ